MHDAVNLGDDRFVPRMARFEQLDDSRQTAGDVLRLRRGARDTNQRITRIHFLAVLHHDVRAGRQKVLALFARFAPLLCRSMPPIRSAPVQGGERTRPSASSSVATAYTPPPKFEGLTPRLLSPIRGLPGQRRACAAGRTYRTGRLCRSAQTSQRRASGSHAELTSRPKNEGVIPEADSRRTPSTTGA